MHPHHAPTLAGKAHKHWVSNTGVADGARTRDNRNHNPGLYQLSYSHRRRRNYSRATLSSALNFSFNNL